MVDRQMLISVLHENICKNHQILRRIMSFGTPPFMGHKQGSKKSVHINFLFLTYDKLQTPLFRGKGHFLWVSKSGVDLHSGDN